MSVDRLPHIEPHPAIALPAPHGATMNPPERIFRYQLAITDEPVVAMPAGARVLSVARERQPGEYVEHLDMWALVNPDADVVEREFRVVGTGNPMPADCGGFVGTVATHDGMFVWHVFEARALDGA